MRRIIFGFLIAMLVAGCSDRIKPAPGETSVSFSASLADQWLADSLGTALMTGDKMAVSGAANPFTASSVRDGVGLFEGYAQQADTYYSVYPYTALKEFGTGDGDLLQAVLELPLIQVARPGTIPEGTGLAVAATTASDRDFQLHPLVTYLKFTISPKAGKIRSVSVIHEEGYRLSGEFSVDCASEYGDVFPMPNSASNVVLRPESDFFEPGEYYVAAFPHAFNGSLVFAFEDEDGKFALKTISGRNDLTDTHIRDIGTIGRLRYEPEPVYPSSSAYINILPAGGTFNLKFIENKECTVSIAKGSDWMEIVRTKDVNQHVCTFSVSENLSETRVGEIVIQTLDGSFRLVYTIVQLAGQDASMDRQRAALIDLYNATGGDNWKNNTNWCSDKPLSEWYGVSVNDDYGGINDLYLGNNNLTGTLPPSIKDLRGMLQIVLRDNNLTGEIPAGIYGIRSVYLDNNAFTSLAEPDTDQEFLTMYLQLSDNELSGKLPEFLTHHRLISLDLSGNEYTGELPASYSRLLNSILSNIRLDGNSLSGRIPEEIATNPYFNVFWSYILFQNGKGFDVDGLELYAPQTSVTSWAEGEYHTIDTGELFSQNTYTLIYYWNSKQTGVDIVQRWYDAYHDKGFEVLALYPGSSYSSFGYKWPYLSTRNLGSYNMKYAPSPSLGLVDSEGRIVVNPCDWSVEKIQGLLEEKFGELPLHPDDGKVTVLQTAQEGNGIDLVFLGDGYMQEHIDDGTYHSIMRQAVMSFFSSEPFLSYRSLFNVYYVNVISETSEYGTAVNTALKCRYGEGTSISGDDALCKAYAARAVSEDRLDETTIVVVMNSDKYGGSTYMYSPVGGDHGSGMAVSYVPKVDDDDKFRCVLVHEAGGHGFAKLADEYYNTSGAAVSDKVKQDIREKEQYGWYRNCDFTAVPSLVKWAHFLEDERYASERLGIYEGAFSYPEGIYRPSYNSIMRSNSGKFNAPSREAIWYRIHRLAYGDAWQYDFEDFVEYDINTNL